MNYNNKRLLKGGRPSRVTTNKRRINGQTVDIKNDTGKYGILRATKVMSQNNAASFQGTANESLEALNLLESVGCSVANKSDANSDANFSLIAAQTDNEVLTNPNISGSQNPKNRKKLDASKSFPNADDPFYEIDVGRDELEREKEATNRRLETGTKTLRLAADIATVNTNKTYDSTLKQFTKQTIHNGWRSGPFDFTGRNGWWADWEGY